MSFSGNPFRDTPSSGRKKAVVNRDRFCSTALASGLVDASQLAAAEEAVAGSVGSDARGDVSRWDTAVADWLVSQACLTKFQAEQLLAGRRKLTLGQYRILDELGRGGMGQVFRAEHALMGRTVAVKVLPHAKSSADTEAAFQREIRMLSRLEHPNLVRALDAGHDGQVYYLVTELVPGIDLRRQVVKYGKLDDVLAASVISQAALALSYAHGQGLVHRDVKPANLLVTPEGTVKLLDLGLAGSTFEEESARLGRVVGTLDFIAPEQIRSSDDVGPAADIYALGCTLYFSLTGELPFPGGTRQEKTRRHLHDIPRPVRLLAPSISPGMEQLVTDMMQKDPLQRPPSAAAVVDRLQHWLPSEPLAMPRGKASRRGAGGVQQGSSSSRDGSWAGNPSTTGTRSAQLHIDTERFRQPSQEGTTPGFVHWMGVIIRSLLVSAVVSVAVTGLLRLADSREVPTGGWLLGGGLPTALGGVLFGSLLTAQLFIAGGRQRVGGAL